MARTYILIFISGAGFETPYYRLAVLAEWGVNRFAIFKDGAGVHNHAGG